MEPDFDKLVSNKIRQAEQRPVVWNKEAVWQNVQSETNTTRRHYIYFYYAAAAMILLLIYFTVIRTPSEVKPQITDGKIKFGPEAAESEKKYIVSEKNNNQASNPVVEDSENAAKVSVSKIPESEWITTPSIQEIKDTDVVIEPLLTDIKIQEEELYLPEELAAPEQKIKPIVGVITESYLESFEKVKQRKRLRKLESPSPVPWEDSKNALVFTVRK